VSAAPDDARALLRECFAAGVRAVEGGAAVRAALRVEDGTLRVGALPDRFAVRPRTAHVLACGKAAVAMARAFHEVAGSPAAGLAIAREPGDLPPPWRVLVGGHPLPTEASAAAGRAALELVARVPGDAELVVLLSGGASALSTAPLPGLAPEDLRAITDLLLRSGAEIGELNCVRKHLAAASGGRLAEAATARAIVALVLSDVLDDDLATIGSGPFAADPTTFADAVQVLRRRAIWSAAPAAVRAQLERGLRGELAETPKPGSPVFARVRHHVAANNAVALSAAAAHARALGLFCPEVATAPLRGEARDVGRELARRARAPDAPRDARRDTLWVHGGETTVTVRGTGRGGRCQELALGAALALSGERGVTLLAAGTDGSDGPTDAAGAFADGETVARGHAAGVDAADALRRNDAYDFFAREGGLFRTGPTGTNALDVVLVLRTPRS
jgi:glycerate-2-kinase